MEKALVLYQKLWNFYLQRRKLWNYTESYGTLIDEEKNHGILPKNYETLTYYGTIVKQWKFLKNFDVLRVKNYGSIPKTMVMEL